QGLPRRAKRRLQDFPVEFAAAGISLHEIRQRIHGSVPVRSVATDFPAVPEDRRWIRTGGRDVHHAEAGDARAAQRTSPTKCRDVALAYKSVHAAEKWDEDCGLEQ